MSRNKNILRATTLGLSLIVVGAGAAACSSQSIGEGPIPASTSGTPVENGAAELNAEATNTLQMMADTILADYNSVPSAWRGHEKPSPAVYVIEDLPDGEYASMEVASVSGIDGMPSADTANTVEVSLLKAPYLSAPEVAHYDFYKESNGSWDAYGSRVGQDYVVGPKNDSIDVSAFNGMLVDAQLLVAGK